MVNIPNTRKPVNIWRRFLSAVGHTVRVCGANVRPDSRRKKAKGQLRKTLRGRNQKPLEVTLWNPHAQRKRRGEDVKYVVDGLIKN